MRLKLSISKDLGQRPIELTWLTIGDIDLSTGLVSLTGAKHTVGRNGKLKPRTLELLKIWMQNKKMTNASKIYNGKSSNFSANYRHYRNRIANEYGKPELKQVQLYDFSARVHPCYARRRLRSASHVPDDDGQRGDAPELPIAFPIVASI